MLNSGSPTFLLSIERPWFWTFHEENAWEIKHFMQIVKMYNWMSIGSTVNLASSCPWRGRRQIGGVWARPENKEVGRATVASLMKRLEERKKKKTGGRWFSQDTWACLWAEGQGLRGRGQRISKGKRLMGPGLRRAGRLGFKNLCSLKYFSLISGCPGLTPIIRKLACSH